MVLHTAFCRPGEVSCILGLSRSGFVPGEVIRPEVRINNIFPGKIKESSLSLNQVIVATSYDVISVRTSEDGSRHMTSSVNAS